ncbi:hypothetical protein CNECB9_500020 [Cupriavidus necator]|uniref:Uncharacterized protein n=1 Tax=Cupriavidus necator TaxID=106590 RepID=A0A1K0IN52_CUPNE|nr:hypothetical protein CNECB9_500020 [Cupriavidus necator]
MMAGMHRMGAYNFGLNQLAVFLKL